MASRRVGPGGELLRTLVLLGLLALLIPVLPASAQAVDAVVVPIGRVGDVARYEVARTAPDGGTRVLTQELVVAGPSIALDALGDEHVDGDDILAHGGRRVRL